MIRIHQSLITFAVVSVAAVVTACSEPSGPRAGTRVELRAAAPRTASSSFSVLSAGTVVTSLRIMVGSAGLGYGDQFGCIDCQGNEQHASTTPKWIDVPIGNGSVLLESEMAAPGSYSEMEVELRRAPSADATIEIGGEYDGTPFKLRFDVQGNSRHALAQPLVVTQQSATAVSANLQFPIQAWFTGTGGTALNPLDNSGRSAIEANLRAYFVNEAESPEARRD